MNDKILNENKEVFDAPRILRAIAKWQQHEADIADETMKYKVKSGKYDQAHTNQIWEDRASRIASICSQLALMSSPELGAWVVGIENSRIMKTISRMSHRLKI